MCGVAGCALAADCAPTLYEGLSLLQHRGQDAAGIVTMAGGHLFTEKGYGLASEVFNRRRLDSLRGGAGLAHVRYTTAGSARALSEIQPFYVNSPFGMALVHNGNLTNADELRARLGGVRMRHINTESDSEVLLNIFADELAAATGGVRPDAEAVFAAAKQVFARCRGAYAAIALIAGFGLVAFRDRFGIRPLAIGVRGNGRRREFMVASESVALSALGFGKVRDLAPGEVFIAGLDGKSQTRMCADNAVLRPCIFEFVYLARPDSKLDGALVYQTRIRMGRELAAKIRREHPGLHIDSVIPVPDSARPAAMELAQELGLPYREGLVKNRYIGRTFMMPGKRKRRLSARRKLNIVAAEFTGKSVLLVDDSVVRGTTSGELVQMAREAGAKRIYLASAAPPVRYPNVYGIDLPTHSELIAAGQREEQIADFIGADLLIYQDLDALVRSVAAVSPKLGDFETSCFSGDYITGDVDEDFLAKLSARRGASRDEEDDDEAAAARQIALSLSPR